MREQANIVSNVLQYVAGCVRPGITTKELDERAEQRIRELGAEPYNKNYKPHWADRPFPAILCTSVNNEIAHGVPSDRTLQEGDILSLDVGIKYKDKCGDACLTVPVGKIANRESRLLYYAKMALMQGVQAVKAGATVRDVARAIETYAMTRGYVVNETFSGHGIGAEMHEAPSVPHYTPNNFEQVAFVAGQVICLEPMLTFKDKFGKLEGNGWTVSTRDGKPSAFFEHMVEITETGCEILTSHL